MSPLTADRRYGFGGGLNTLDNPTALKDDELADARNCEYSLTGALVTRGGQARITTVPADAHKVTSGFRYYMRSGTKIDVFFRNQTMYKKSGTDGTSIDTTAFTVDTTFTFAELNNNLYYTNGVDTVSAQTIRKYTGSGNASAPSGSPATACKFLVTSTIGQRLFAAGDGTDIVYWSAQGNGEDWTTAYDAGFVRVRTGDEQGIQALCELRAGMLVFKKDSLHLITGADPQTFTVKKISGDTGTTAPYSVATDGTRAYFLFQNTVYVTDGVTVKPISMKITPTIASMSNLSAAVGVNYNPTSKPSQYRLHVQSAGGSNNDRVLVCFPDQPASGGRLPWSLFDSTNVASAWTLGGDNGELYTGDYSGHVNQQDSGTDDFGTVITAYGRTGWQFLSEPDRRKKLKRVWVVAKQTGNYTLRVYTSYDGLVNSSTYDSISLSTSTPSLDIDFALDSSGLDGGSGDFATNDITPVQEFKSVAFTFYCLGLMSVDGYTIINRKKRLR